MSDKSNSGAVMLTCTFMVALAGIFTIELIHALKTTKVTSKQICNIFTF